MPVTCPATREPRPSPSPDARSASASQPRALRVQHTRLPPRGFAAPSPATRGEAIRPLPRPSPSRPFTHFGSWTPSRSPDALPPSGTSGPTPPPPRPARCARALACVGLSAQGTSGSGRRAAHPTRFPLRGLRDLHLHHLAPLAALAPSRASASQPRALRVQHTRLPPRGFAAPSPAARGEANSRGEQTGA